MTSQTYASLQNQRNVLLAEGSKYVAVEEGLFYSLFKPVISQIWVDAEWYLERYQDVGEAVVQGLFASAEEHYRAVGYFEHRMPYELLVDEEWYLDQYPDVKEAVASGTFQSGQQHFELRGYSEGRHPFAHFILKQA